MYIHTNPVFMRKEKAMIEKHERFALQTEARLSTNI
jgi:hypothetical protein